MTTGASARPSDLALLVAAERRLDCWLEAARADAAAVITAARRRAEAADAALAGDVAREQARIAAESAARLAAQRTEIDQAARAEIARYEAVRGDALAGLARALAAKLAVLAREEAA
ncbi:MAG: hypothetical protein E6J90_51795 [Deltaproteobacteria bacterium]|nr:MAG: hypothetical protein E6J90_51795 [Deltaproteobacteria bacterium]TMQ16166.1 MAG: hypothetical protein E6J91_12205 [Deltaproteobacteria bacterium]